MLGCVADQNAVELISSPTPSSATPGMTERVSPESTQAPLSSTSIPAVPTITPTATSLPPTSPPSNSRFVNIYASPVGGTGVEGSVTVFWSGNENELYYAIRISREPLELDWYIYDVANDQVQQIDKPPPHDRSYEALASKANRSGVSPSGRFYLEAVLSDPLATPNDDPYVCQPHDIKLVDTLTDQRSLVKKETCFGFTQVYWALDESRYYFGTGGDGINEAEYADLGKESVWLGPIQGKISPDGEWLAYNHSIHYTLGLMNLSTGEDIELGGSRTRITWSPNSEYFYYLTNGFPFSSEVIAYEIATGEHISLISIGEIKKMGLCEPSCYYAVAPNHEMIAIYTLNYLNVVALPNE